MGRCASGLVSNPMVSRTLTGALEAREKAAQAQEPAMAALNIPSAADLERLTRRVRQVSQRLEAIEDSLDRLEERALAAAEPSAGRRIAALEQRLEEIARDLAAVRQAVVPGEQPVPRAQERLTVSDS